MKQSRGDRLAASALARRSLEFVVGRRKAIGGITALALAGAALGAVDPLAMKYLFDAIGRSESRRIGAAIVALLALEAARALVSGWLAVLTWKVRLAVDYQMRSRLFEKLFALPMDYHSGHGVGGTMNA